VRFWLVLVVGTALFVAAPIVVIMAHLFVPSHEIWSHLASTVLPRYVANSLFLMLGVGAGTLILGVSTAWLVTMTSFPWRRFFEWSLVIPLAIPAYVIAFTYTGLLEYGGPMQTLLRDYVRLAVRHRVLVPPDPLVARGYCHDDPGLLSVRVHAFPGSFPGAVGMRSRCQQNPGQRRMEHVFQGGACLWPDRRLPGAWPWP
jgi:hypothetical protein